MDQELQFLINTLYGNKLNEKQLARIMQMAQQNPQYLLNMRNAANAKMPGSKLDMSNIRANNIASLKTPTLGRTDFNHSTANKGIAKNDISAVDDFKQAFRQARLGGNKTFFWKKTKANPSGMFSTEMATSQTSSPENIPVKNSLIPVTSIKADMSKTDLPIFKGPRISLGLANALSPKTPEIGTNSYLFDVNAANAELRSQNKQNPHNNMSMRPYLKQGGAISPDEYAKNLITRALNNDPEALQEIEQIMQAAQLGDPKAVSIAQSILKIIEVMKQQSGVKAKLGAKLNYINKLKGNCPEGEELVYMKQGGRVCPVCQKKAEKAQGGKKLEEKKKNAVSDFKEKRKAVNPNDTVNTKFGPRDLNGKTKYPKYDAKKENYDFNTRMRVQEKDEKSGKKVIGSACGSKMKKKK